ncbi:aconitase X catalytic domain-containing protein [Candidatus Bathyarchaeota archaeon]|nr:aconitase X catalytic domain-containing protein [Candidatus Bathyarchaeota archaeon]
MHLTAEEEKVYNGERGWAYQTAMKILVKLGDLFDAEKLIPIESAHVSGISYKTLGDAPIEFLEALAKTGAKAKVASTVNPSGLDYEGIMRSAVPETVKEKQEKIVELYKKMGIKPVLTCTPYYVSKPKQGSHLAWAESSAVVYANSVLGSWTNREGGPSALASALIGKTPNYGLHKPENHEPSVRVKVETGLKSEAEYGALGIFLGKNLVDKVPVIEGLRYPREADLKQLGAALASSGMTSVFYPCSRCPKKAENLEKLAVDELTLKKAFEDLSTCSEEPDMVFVGCPHCSLNEVRHVARLVQGRKVKENVMFWVCVSRHVKAKAALHVQAIEAAGGKVVSDLCAVVTWLRELGVDTLMTNSAKTAFYSPTMNKVNVRFATLKQCIETACYK